MQPQYTPDFEAWFWDGFDTSGECWTWLRGTCNQGYGRVRVNGKRTRVHRVAWELANKQSVPGGLKVRHKVCDNPPCGRPSHLETGTHAQNMRDMVEHGRHTAQTNLEQARARIAVVRRPPQGESHHRAKMTDAQVIDMRRERDAGSGLTDLAAKYAINRKTVWQIVTRRLWAHI